VLCVTYVAQKNPSPTAVARGRLSPATQITMHQTILDDEPVSVSTGELMAALGRMAGPPAAPPAGRPVDVEEVLRELRPIGDEPRPAPDYLNPRIIDLRNRAYGYVSLDPCPVCDSRAGVPMYGIEGLPHRLIRCDECGLGRLTPLPSPQELAKFYPQEYYGSPGAKFEPLTEAVVRFIGTVHVRSLSKSLPSDARILDVGCGRGVLLSSLADRGHEVHGMDVSETALAGADPRAQFKVAGCLTECDYPDRHFDQVILWHVLEHLTNPREVLAEIHRILKPGGQVIVAVPNFSSLQAEWSGPAWFHLDLPRHLYHFPVEGLRRLLERTKFDIAREQHFSLRQNPFGWVQSAFNRRDTKTRNRLYNMLHNRTGENVVPDPFDRLKLRAAYLGGMPLALAVSLWATVRRRGASVCVVGRK
jgi:SAM-dependent methyltransferase